MITRSKSAALCASSQSGDSGKVLAVLLIYLTAFVLSLVLFLHGYRSLAFVLLFAVWAVLSAYLHKAGRP